MLTRFLNYQRRRWGYAFLEVMSASVFCLCSSILFSEHRYVLGFNDPGMAKITAACFMATSSGLFVLCCSLKKIDHDK